MKDLPFARSGRAEGGHATSRLNFIASTISVGCKGHYCRCRRDGEPAFRTLLLAFALSLVGASLAAQSVWVEQGPGPIIPSAPYGQASGAINCAAVDPANPARIFVATVNGGIWMTTNGTNSNPFWANLTDQLPSLAISGIAFSPLDPNHNTLYAGFGDFSNGMDTGNAPGIIMTTNGGLTWNVMATNDLTGRRVFRIVPTGQIDPNSGKEIIVAAVSGTSTASIAAQTAELTSRLYFPLPRSLMWRKMRPIRTGSSRQFPTRGYS